jgi:GT2 family glycosyltransferase
MLKRKMVNEIGLLDDNMFLLYSDSDYCYWARYRGWSVWYEPDSRVRHRLGKGSKSISEWHEKDMSAFMDKWGISMDPDGKGFTAGRLFHKLDNHP